MVLIALLFGYRLVSGAARLASPFVLLIAIMAATAIRVFLRLAINAGLTISITAATTLKSVLFARRFAPSAFLMIAVLLAFAVLAIGLLNPFVRKELEYAHDRASMPAIFDSQGRFLGIYPPGRFADWSDGARLPADHSAVPLTDVPQIWRACLIQLEDRRFDGLSGLLGIDPFQIASSAWSTATGSRRRGASTLLMQVTRMLHDQHPDKSEPIGALALRKAAEIVGANALANLLKSRDARAAERYLGMHLPLVVGTPGSRFGDPLFGVFLAGQILWGKLPEQLLPEEQAILAAAVKRPILIAPPGDREGHKKAQARWELAKRRAAFCLSALPDAERLQAARKRLATMPLPAGHIDPELANALPKSPTLAWQIVVNPVRRARHFAKEALVLADREISATVEGDWRGRLAAIYLTTDASDMAFFQRALAGGLDQVRTAASGRLFGQIGSNDRNNGLRINIVLQDEAGNIRRHFSSHSDIFTSRTPIASTAKIGAAVALGRLDRPTTNYCTTTGSVPVANMPRACASDAPRISAATAFARSDNAAIFTAIEGRKASRSSASQVAGILGFEVPGLASSTSLTLGLAELTTAEQLRSIRAVAVALAHDNRDVGLPRLISALTLIDPRTGAGIRTSSAEAGSLAQESVRQLFPDAQSRAFFKAVLRAVSEPGGTLASIGNLAEAKKGELFAKTGTHSAAGQTKALTVTGIVIRNGRPWTFAISVSSPRNGAAIGQTLSASVIAPLVRSLLAAPAPRRHAEMNSSGRGT